MRVLNFSLFVIVLAATGCGRHYGGFTLPPLTAQPGTVDWTWTAQPEPVQSRGPAGSYDAADTLNPSVIRLANGTLLDVYSGYDGRTWHTATATSSDNGRTWTRVAKVLSPDPKTWEGDYIAANGSALADNGTIRYWYQASRRNPQIGLATSTDSGQTWTKHASPVLPTGPRGSWDERGVADPYVIRIDGTLYMYYLGQDRARRQQLGVARSTDNGLTWQKHLANPILELGAPGAFDETGLGEPAVWSGQGSYWMLYTARDPKEFRRIGLARSQDGIHWERVTTKPVITGDQPWNAAVVCDPTVEPTPSEGVRVWFGGGNRPEPAENLNGQIGFGTFRIRISSEQAAK